MMTINTSLLKADLFIFYNFNIVSFTSFITSVVLINSDHSVDPQNLSVFR